MEIIGLCIATPNSPNLKTMWMWCHRMQLLIDVVVPVRPGQRNEYLVQAPARRVYDGDDLLVDRQHRIILSAQ